MSVIPSARLRLASVSICALVATCASAAFAQTRAGATSPDASGETVVIEDIVVTAQKSAQRLQDVPLSITAISGEALQKQGITNSQDLVGRVLGLNVFAIGNGVNILIRGIGSTSVSAQNETTSAFEVDGVYRAKPQSTAAVFYDVDRVEVLKGPQGTLFGRNATVGAVRVITRNPVFDNTAEATLEAGNYDLMRGTAAVNAALGQTVAVRVAGQISRRDGYTSNGTNDARDTSGRAKLLWEPNDRIQLVTTVDYYERGGAGPGGVTLNSVPVTATTPANSPARHPITGEQFFVAMGPFKSNFEAGDSKVRDWGAATELNWDLGGAVLTFQPAYRYSLLNARGQANSGVALGTFQDVISDQWSGELRLASPASSAIRWVAGLYFFDEHTTQFLNSISLATALPATAPTATTFPNTSTGRRGGVTFGVFDTRSYAAFGQATVPLTDALRVTAGLRYTKERKELGGEGYTYAFSTTAPNFAGAAPADRVAGTTFVLASRNRFEKLNWKVGLEWDVTPDSLFYLNASTGFKSGGANALDSATAPASAQRGFDPENLTEFAGGLKNTLLGGRLILNVEGYYWKYSGRQQLYRAAVNGAGLIRFITTNLGDQRIWGGAVEMIARPTRNGRLSASVSYDNGRFTNDPGNFLVAQGLSDFRKTRVPFQAPWQANWSYTHDFPLANGGNLSLEYSGRFASGHFTETRSTPISYQKSYSKHDASLGYTTPDEHLQLRAWVRNFTDKAILGSAISSNTIVTGNQPFLGYYEAPRTFGITATFRY
jgi:iron complex outermembrane receptor protein